MTSIRSFYKNKNILITNSTSFVGLGLVERLLRVFPDVGDIFLIVQKHPGEILTNRRESFIKNPVFYKLKKEQPPSDYSKLKLIQSDFTQKNLSLSSDTITKLKQSVNLIFNGNTSLPVNQSLTNTITSHINANNDLLDIAQECKKLECFMQISTLDSNSRKEVNHIAEDIYKDPELIKVLNSKPSNKLNVKVDDIFKDWLSPNSYLQNAVENLCELRKNKFSIGIHRLGNVMPAYTKPAPYWIGHKTGFARVLMEAGRGFVLNTNPLVNANCLPVDFVVNAILISAYRTAIDKKFKVYNNTTNTNPIKFMDTFSKYVEGVFNYEALVAKRKELLEMKDVNPGSKESKMILNIREFEKFYDTQSFLLQNNFNYDSENVDAMWNDMSDDEKKLMPFDVRSCDWSTYYKNMHSNLFGTSPINFNSVM